MTATTETYTTDKKITNQPHDKFFGRRKGKPLTKASKERFESILPSISITVNEDTIFNADALFQTEVKTLWFEVGFGGGEHMVWLAQKNPDVSIIGCEPYMNGTAKLLRDIEDDDIKNIRIYPDDARHIMEKMDDASLDKAFALFGDPWRKYRHRERRFIGNDNLNRFARILKDGAILRIATDHSIYLQWILRWAPVHPDFEWLDEGPQDWATRKDDWPETRYERKALREGRKSSYLTFKRKPRSA